MNIFYRYTNFFYQNNSTDLAKFLFKNRHEIGEVLVDYGVVEHLF